MTSVSQIASAEERKERRRLHLREVSDDPEAPVEAPVESVGTTLRTARLERGEEPATVAAKLKMRRDQLEAIEEGDFARLPGRTYAVGFIKAYARHLGLDAAALVQRFKDETAANEIAKPVELVFPEATEERRMLPSGSIVIWAMLIAMVIYVISYLTLPDRRARTTTAKAEPAVVVVDPAAEPAAPASDVADLWRPPSDVTYVAGDTALPQKIEETNHTLIGAGEAPALAFQIAEVAGIPQAAEPGANQPQPPAPRLVLKALEQTYIRVRESSQAGGAVLVDRVLDAGETFVAPDRPGLLMVTGNAGGLQVEVDGRVIGVMGRRGEVKSRVPVDPSYFLESIATTQ